jgi:hypothetical protein
MPSLLLPSTACAVKASIMCSASCMLTLATMRAQTNCLYNHTCNTHNCCCSWTPPYMPNRMGAPCTPLPPLQDWVLIVRNEYGGYYYNTRHGESLDTIPPGFIPCAVCEQQLATKRCAVGCRPLCFSCYRKEHCAAAVRACGKRFGSAAARRERAAMTSAGTWRHEWAVVQPFICRVCATRPSETVCYQCSDTSSGSSDMSSTGHSAGSSSSSSSSSSNPTAAATVEDSVYHYCAKCWQRVHSSAACASHVGVPLLVWAQAVAAAGRVCGTEEAERILQLEAFTSAITGSSALSSADSRRSSASSSRRSSSSSSIHMLGDGSVEGSSSSINTGGSAASSSERSTMLALDYEGAAVFGSDRRDTSASSSAPTDLRDSAASSSAPTDRRDSAASSSAEQL